MSRKSLKCATRRQAGRGGAALIFAGGLGLLLCAIAPAHAEIVYVGLGIGNASPTVDQGSVQFQTQDWSPNSTAWRLFGGFMFAGPLGIEAGYIPLGKARVTTSGGDFFEAKTAGFELTPILSVHPGLGISVFARGGIIFWSTDATYRFTSIGSGVKSVTGSSVTWSLGARYDLLGPLGVRAEYMHYAIDKTKSGAGEYDVLVLSAVVGF